MDERGSLTLEALLTLPLLMFFGLALSWLLLAAKAEAALREAVDEAVKTTAAYAYPVDLAAEWIFGSEAARRFEEQVSKFLPEAVRTLIRQQWTGELSGGEDKAVWSELPVHRAWAEPLVKAFVDRDKHGEPLLDPQRLSVRAVLLPTFGTEAESYFGLAAEYRLRLPVPFFSREIVLTAAALERCWVGDKHGGGGY